MHQLDPPPDKDDDLSASAVRGISESINSQRADYYKWFTADNTLSAKEEAKLQSPIRLALQSVRRFFRKPWVSATCIVVGVLLVLLSPLAALGVTHAVINIPGIGKIGYPDSSNAAGQSIVSKVASGVAGWFGGSSNKNNTAAGHSSGGASNGGSVGSSSANGGNGSDTGDSSGSSAVTSPALTTLRPIVSAAGFTHPGVFVSLPELEFTRQKILQGADPWTTIYKQAKASSFGAATTNWSTFADATNTSKPCNPNSTQGCVVYCGANDVPDYGCTQEHNDTTGAYTEALLWYYSGDETYAKRAVAILNGYAHVIKGHPGANGVLEASWAAEMLLRAAEIVRYTYTPTVGSPSFDIKSFSAMLRQAFIPLLNGNVDDKDGNWRSSDIDGLMNIAVFLDDRGLYNQSLAMWRAHVPTNIYLTSDGSIPLPLSSGAHTGKTELTCYWLQNLSSSCKTNPKTDPHATFQNGQNQESCRDMWHTSASFGGIINAAETAWIQGTDLYTEQQTRIMTGLLYLVQIMQSFSSSGYPTNFCSGVSGLPTTPANPSSAELVVAYNAYVVRKGGAFKTLAIPGYSRSYSNNDPMASYIAATRIKSNPGGLVVAWETLTHYNVGSGIAL